MYYTHPERVLYFLLDQMQINFKPQYPVGRFRADAYLPDHNIMIEVDGEFWHNRPKQKRRDHRKDAFYKSRGYKVARVPSKIFLSDPKAWIKAITTKNTRTSFGRR